MNDPLLPPEPLPQRISRILAWIAGAIILVGCAAAISIDVVTRFFLGRAFMESFEVSGYALAACLGLGLGFAVSSKAHIRVDILVNMLPRPLKVASDLLASLVLAVVALALAWYCWGTLAQSWTMGARSVSQMQTPLILPQGIWWFGMAWFACMAVIVPIQAIVRLVRGDHAGFDALVGSLLVNEEIEQAGAQVDAETQAVR